MDSPKKNVPNSFDLEKKPQAKGLGNFEAVIDIQDIAGCNVMSFNIPCPTHCHQNDQVHILQICLYNHGDL